MAGPDSPNTSFTPIRFTGTGAFSDRHSHTAPPSPPITECSSTVTTLPVSLAAATTSSSSRGLIVWILITFASTPSAASFSAASRFFQAEDGIRDTSVTGVQTGARPI